ncbi:MAG: PEP-CTERM sorting domain-containing protein [Phycisphaerales bacterium]
MKTALTLLGLSAATLSASAGGLVIAQYELSDHPDANLNPPPYGMRLDNVIGAGAATLSFDFHGDSLLTVTDNGGDLSINISGTMFGGVVDGMGGYVSATSYAVDFNYGALVNNFGGGWAVNGVDAANTGTVTNLDTNEVFTLNTTTIGDGTAFAFLPDGHRLDGDDSTFVGRGWMTEETDGTDPLGGTRDWIFTATKVPAPSSVALLGLGGLVATRRRR